MTVNKLGMYISYFFIKGFKENLKTSKIWIKETNIWNGSDIFYNKRRKFAYMFINYKFTNL